MTLDTWSQGHASLLAYWNTIKTLAVANCHTPVMTANGTVKLVKVTSTNNCLPQNALATGNHRTAQKSSKVSKLSKLCCYALPTRHRTGNALQKFVKYIKNIQLINKTEGKKWVLSSSLNKYKLSASRTAAGKLFHTTGLATEKALSPNFVLVRGTE